MTKEISIYSQAFGSFVSLDSGLLALYKHIAYASYIRVRDGLLEDDTMLYTLMNGWMDEPN